MRCTLWNAASDFDIRVVDLVPPKYYYTVDAKNGIHLTSAAFCVALRTMLQALDMRHDDDDESDMKGSVPD